MKQKLPGKPVVSGSSGNPGKTEKYSKFEKEFILACLENAELGTTEEIGAYGKVFKRIR